MVSQGSKGSREEEGEDDVWNSSSGSRAGLSDLYLYRLDRLLINTKHGFIFVRVYTVRVPRLSK